MKKILLTVLVLSVSLGLAACNRNTKDESPQSVIDKAWGKLADKNAEYETGQINFEGNSNIELENNKVDVEGKGNLLFERSDSNNYKTAIKVDLKADGTLEGKSGSLDIEGELRSIGDNLYISLNGVDVKTEDPQTNLMVNLIGNIYKNKWIALPNTKEKPKTLETENFRGKEVAEIAKKNNFFEVKTALNDRKYDLSINPEKVKSYFQEVSSLADNKLSPEDLKSIDQFLNNLDYTLQVQIDSDYNLSWIKGTFHVDSKSIPNENLKVQQLTLNFEGKIKNSETEGNIDLILEGDAPGKLHLNFKTTNENKKVVIEIPEETQEFDLESLLGPGLDTQLAPEETPRDTQNEPLSESPSEVPTE